MEIWKQIQGYEGLYEISDRGRIKNTGSEKSKLATLSKNGDLFLKKQINNAGYERLLLTNGSNRKTYSVHRLVAIAFIPNPEGKKQVNHIDGNKSNNCVENLEWSTSSENIKHAFVALGKKSCWKGRTGKLSHCSIKIMCNETKVVYDSMKEAAKDNKICAADISKNISGKIKRLKGLTFIKV
jgi:hypothetical protein